MREIRLAGAVAVAVALLLRASPGSGQALGDPPFILPDNVELVTDVVYSHTRERPLLLDLFIPRDRGGERPAVVFIHGGGWRAGSREHFHRQAAHLAREGVVTLCIEYRLSGEAKFPAAIHDAKAAVRWVRAHAREYGVDPDRIGVVGGSAGAHIAAMLALTSDVPELEGEGGNPGESTEVQAAVLFNPALDLARIDNPAPEQWLGVSFADDPALWRFASPTSHVDSISPPVLILHGDADSVVPYRHALDLAFMLERTGARAELFTAAGAGHGFFNEPPWYAPTLEAMTAFIQDALGLPEGAHR